MQAYALVCEEQGDVLKSRELFKRGLAANKRHQPLWQAWAIAEWRWGQYKKARELFQQGVWADPSSKENVYLWQVCGSTCVSTN